MAPNGLVTTLTFDGNGQLAKVTSAEGAERIIEMAPNGLLTRFGKKADPTLVGSHQFTYDGKGLLVSDQSPDGQGSAQTIESSTDVPKRVVTHTTAEGRVKRFEVDRNPAAVSSTETAPSERRTNQMVTGINGASLVVLSSVQDDYAGVKRVSTSPDTSRSTSTFASDPKVGSDGQYASKTVHETMPGNAANRTTTTVHTRTLGPNQSEINETSVNGSVWRTTFRPADFSTETQSPLDRRTTVWLDALVDRVARSQAGPAVGGDPISLPEVTYAYKPGPGLEQGKIASVAVGGLGGRVVSYEYDSQGRVYTVTAPDGKITTFNARDILGRVTQMTLPGGRVVTQGYDVDGNVTSVLPRTDATHEMTYSLSGELLASYLAPNVAGAPRTTSYVYDRDKMLKELISPIADLKQTILRDAAGRVTNVNETTAGANRTRAFTYNSGGQLSQQVASETAGGTTTTATQSFGYAGSRHTTDTQLVTGGSSRVLTRDHDGFLRLTSLSLGGVSGSLNYGYDLDGLTTNMGGLVATRGSTVGLVKSLERTGQEKETFTYESFGAPLTMVASYNGVAKGGLALTFDAASGRIVTKAESWTFGGLPAKTWTYDYDTTGRLAVASDGSTTRTYTYEANGNRTGATVDAQDRVTSQTDDGITTAYTYDAHGNVLSRARTGSPTQTLTWDSQGSLLSVTQTPSLPVKYILDAQGRRVGRRLNGVLEREWFYDGQLRIVGEVVYVAGVATRFRLYGYLPERHLPVTMSETVGATTKTYRIYGDHLGSLRAVVESGTGNVVQTMQHGPWGEILNNTVMGGFVRVPFGFAGGNYDESTGLVRFGAREYDSGTGRWLSKDEAQFGGGWNFYEYAAGDPVNKVDPTGFLDGTFDVGAEIAKGALRNGLKGSVAGAAGEGLAGAAAGIGIGGYLYCLLVDCGNGPLGDFPAADEGPDEGGAPEPSSDDLDAGCGGPRTPAKPEEPKRDCYQEYSDNMAYCRKTYVGPSSDDAAMTLEII